MLRIGLVDANEAASKEFKGLTASVVGGWLLWEFDKFDIELVDASNADVVFLVFAGSVDWRVSCRKFLKRAGVEYRTGARGQRPYIVTGGPIDSAPLTALEQADVVAVGEAYNLVRDLLAKIAEGCNLDTIDEWLSSYEHAITASQVAHFERDPERPWLLAEDYGVLAAPDPYVDWDVPPVKSNDKVVRIIAAKGCHKKCAFCSTTFRQAYSHNPSGRKVIGMVDGLKARGHRVQLLSNDPAHLPYFKDLHGRMDSQSFTIDELRNEENLASVIRNGIGVVRFGVEGLSERTRRAFGKAIPDDEIVELLERLHQNKINTHLFFIIGSPFEREGDWAGVQTLWRRIADVARWGWCRWKFTTFVTSPPAPLSRFVTGASCHPRQDAFRNWILNNAASRHMFLIRGRTTDLRWENLGEVLGLPKAWCKTHFSERQDTFDLAPTFDDWSRLPWELIEWPISTKSRYKVSEVFRRKMSA